NPYTLFYKADTTEHRFKLQTIFPLALGLIKNQTLELRKRLRMLEEEFRIKNGELEKHKKIMKAWETEIKANYLRAIELGILNDAPFPDDSWTLGNYLMFLKQVPERIKQINFPTIDLGATSKVVNYIKHLENNERQISLDIEERKIQLGFIKEFNSTSGNYQ